MKIKPPADVTDFQRNELCWHNSKSGRNYAKAKLIWVDWSEDWTPQEALRESEATATNVLSVRKRSDRDKAPSRNGNQPHVMVMN